MTRQIIEDLQLKRKSLIEQFTDPNITEFETSSKKSKPQRGNVTVNIFKLDTEKRGALVSISQSSDTADEIGSSNQERRFDWQFEVEPNATSFVLEQSHIMISEQTDSILFTF